MCLAQMLFQGELVRQRRAGLQAVAVQAPQGPMLIIPCSLK